MIPCAPFTTRWGRTKPPVGVQLDRGHPLAKGVVRCLLANEMAGGFRDLANPANVYGSATFRDRDRVRPTSSAGMSVGTPLAVGTSHTVTTSVEYVANSSASYPVAFSRYSGTDSDATEIIPGDNVGGAGGNQWGSSTLFLHLGRFSAGAQVSTGGAFTAGRPEPLSLVVPIGGNYLGYRSGRLLGSGPSVAFASGTTFYVGARNTAFPSEGNRYAYFFLHNRVLSAAELAWLHAEPFAMYQPVVRRVYSVAAGGTTPRFRRTQYLRAGSRGAWN